MVAGDSDSLQLIMKKLTQIPLIMKDRTSGLSTIEVDCNFGYKGILHACDQSLSRICEMKGE